MNLRVPIRITEGLLLFAVVFGPLAFGAVEPWSLAILEIAIFLMLFFCLVRGTPDSKFPMHITFLPAVLGILLIGLLQLLNPHSLLAPTTLLPFSASAHDTRHALLLWSSYASLLWCGPQVLDNLVALRRFAWAVLLLGTVVAVVGIAQHGQGNTAIYGLRKVVRPGIAPFGPYYNHDNAAAMMVMSDFVGWGLFFSRLTQLPGTRFRSLELSNWIAIQAILLFFNLVLIYAINNTGSRGAFNSFVVSAWLTACIVARRLRSKGNAWAMLAALSAVAAIYLAVLYNIPQWIAFYQRSPLSSAAYRLSMSRSAFTIFRDFPFFGIGLGCVKAVFPAYKTAIVNGLVEHVHNDWIELLVETGIAGFILCGAGFLSLICYALKSWGASPMGELWWMISGAVAALMAFLLHGFVDFNFQIPANAVLFLGILCWLSAAVGHTNPKDPPTSPAYSRMPRPFKLVTSIATASIFIYCAAGPAISSYFLQKSNEVSPALRPSYLLKAYQWDRQPDTLYRLGASYLNLAENTSSNKRLLRSGLLYSAQAIRADSLNSSYNYLLAAILWRLNRIEDAKQYLGRSSMDFSG